MVCTGCKDGVIEVKVNSVHDVAVLPIKCFWCDGTGTVKKGQAEKLARYQALWCGCAEPGEQKFYDDDEHPELKKHHWRCGNCGKVTQIG